MAKSISTAAKSLVQTLRRFIKPPWEITGPCASPEYRSSLPMAPDYRPLCPATITVKPSIPTSLPETVFDIKYYTRDHRIRPPIKRTIYKKADLEKLKKEVTYDFASFPRPYVNKLVEQDDNFHGGGYQK